ncbi:hypothetical protein GCM10018780_39990 [Streptomyces lanatus]|nr:hypothetical protein GCM10018780_39990 [Streptomyces lanatus]
MYVVDIHTAAATPTQVRIFCVRATTGSSTMPGLDGLNTLRATWMGLMRRNSRARGPGSGCGIGYGGWGWGGYGCGG